MKEEGILYWITGLSGAGKTTIGLELYYEIKKTNKNVILLDGDILKSIVGDRVGYSKEDRKNRAKKYANLGKMLADQGMIVICCTISMFDEIRDWNRQNNKGYVEVYLKVPLETLQQRDQKGMYSKQKKGEFKNLVGIDMEGEFPKNPDIIIENDGRFSVKECVQKILDYKVNFSSNYDRDTQYWNDYYSKGHAIEDPSLFAKFTIEELSKGKTLLELGCGNGRDSVFFMREGIRVTAIDAANKIIEQLQFLYRNEDINFICDDFVCSPTIFVKQYDYCYSRFSLHAINKKQETEVINNVYNALKEGGKFFIEVRSINDELYGKGECVGKNAYIYEGHYRRFIVIQEILENLKEVGFQILYAEEKTGFAPLEGMDPPIIRIVALKKEESS